jgi:hypothetical protein
MASARHQVTFDFGDHPQLLDVLKMMVARERITQKAILIEALTAYFSQKQENLALLLAADKAFGDWDNEEDQVCALRGGDGHGPPGRRVIPRLYAFHKMAGVRFGETEHRPAGQSRNRRALADSQEIGYSAGERPAGDSASFSEGV